MIVSIIVAISKNRVIGKNNQLLWHMPADLRHFREITSHHTVVMGRKTFDSVGKPLPKRHNIVVTRQMMAIEGCELVNSIDAALALCKNENEVFIIGGAEIYKQALPKTERIFLTIIHQEFDGDTLFPQLDDREWIETAREDYPADEKNPYPFSFITLERA